MKYRWLLQAVTVAFVSMFWVAAAPVAFAEAPVQGTGTDTITLSPMLERVADGNTFIDYTFTESLLGIVNGTRVGSGELVIHPDGSVNTQNAGIFTGTIAGRSGTAVMHFRGSGTFAYAHGSLTVTDGTGGLAGVHAEGTSAGSATGPNTLAGTNSFKVHFSAS